MIFYTLKKDSRYPHALVLLPQARKSEEYDGYENEQELHKNMQDTFGSGVTCLPESQFQQELDRRLIHTPEVVALLKRDGDLLGQDLSRHFVYGSYNRPMNSLWARVHEAAIYIQSDRWKTGYHTFVAVPVLLDNETISRYELEFVSHA